MLFRSIFEWVDAFPSSIALRESASGFPVLLTVHLVSLCMFAGLLVMMDLRLMGIGYLRTPLSQIQERLFTWQMLALAVSSISGLILLYSQPLRYYGKVLFWTKMALMGLAGVNALVFHLTIYRSVHLWDRDRVPPVRARVAGAFGLILWGGVVVFGRLTAYDWLTSR